MEDIGEVRPEDVLEVAIGAVEGAHSGEGVLLVEGVEDDQAPVASGIDAVVGGAEDAPDVNIGVAGEAAADLVTVEEEADTRSDRPGQSFNNSRLGKTSKKKNCIFYDIRQIRLLTYLPPLNLDKIIYDNLINIFDLPPLQKFGQIPENIWFLK